MILGKELIREHTLSTQNFDQQSNEEQKVGEDFVNTYTFFANQVPPIKRLAFTGVSGEESLKKVWEKMKELKQYMKSDDN